MEARFHAGLPIDLHYGTKLCGLVDYLLMLYSMFTWGSVQREKALFRLNPFVYGVVHLHAVSM